MAEDPAVERIKTVKSRYEKELMARPNVVGVGIGFRYKNGQPTNEVVLIVNVSVKKPAAELAAEEIVPAEIEGVPVDVQEVGQVRAL